MTRAIWYRHWLEIRFAATVAGIAVGLLCLLHVTVVSLGATGAPPEPDRIPWLVGYAWSFGAAALFAGLLLGGTGIRTGGLEPGHPSLYYTLTLPASRFGLIWTRFAVAAAAAAALLAAMLTAGAVALLVTGQDVPVGVLAASGIRAGLLAVALQAVVGLLLPLWDARLGPLAFVAVVVAGLVSAGNVFNDNTAAWTYGWTPAALAFIAGRPVSWGVAGVLALMVAASLSLAALSARRKDF